MTSLAFPAGFLWGVATAGHQNEGHNVDSDTWFLEQLTPTIFAEPSGAACHGYEYWESDLDLVQNMGLNAYRFSAEWARIEPVEGEFSDDALAHYEAIVDGCVARGLAPILTLNHFTCPHWFASRGSWLNPDAPAWFARYTEAVMRRFGDRLAMVVTLNEPDLPQMLTWAGLPDFVHDLERATLDAASIAAGVERYRSGNVMLEEDFEAMGDGMAAGHRAARAVVKSHRPDLPVGLSLAVVDDVVVGDDPSVRDRKRSEVYGRWLELARDDDFVGVQNYERRYYDQAGLVAPPVGAVLNQMGSLIEPRSLGGAVRYVHEATGVPVLVSEHGVATSVDAERAGFIEPSLAGLLEVIAEGVPVLGYMHWTLMDNFEWIFGYGMQLGLHEVDRETFVRTPKPSARVYASIASANALRGDSEGA